MDVPTFTLLYFTVCVCVVCALFTVVIGKCRVTVRVQVVLSKGDVRHWASTGAFNSLLLWTLKALKSQSSSRAVLILNLRSDLINRKRIQHKGKTGTDNQLLLSTVKKRWKKVTCLAGKARDKANRCFRKILKRSSVW